MAESVPAFKVLQRAIPRRPLPNIIRCVLDGKYPGKHWFPFRGRELYEECRSMGAVQTFTAEFLRELRGRESMRIAQCRKDDQTHIELCSSLRESVEENMPKLQLDLAPRAHRLDSQLLISMVPDLYRSP